MLPVSDVIRLKDITIFGFYGVSPAEREVGQKIQIDLDLHSDLAAACRSDSLPDTINYEAVYSTIMEVVGGDHRYRLLEALGEEICNAVIAEFPVSRVRIRLRKLNLPFPNNLSHVEVELTRDAPML
jgi:dihydroneopterin aldolase